LAIHFHLKLARHPKFCVQPLTALQETWQQAEDELKDFCTSGDKILRDGSTATVCLIVGGSVYIANCGDSSGYLQMIDGTITRATDLHNTLNTDEVQRCTATGAEIRLKEKSGGLFSCCGPFRVQPMSPELQQPRVYPGGLLITRSFGDFYAKDPMLGGIPGSVICDPGQIRFFNLPELKYIVLASDGVWDALEPESVFKIIDDSLNDHLSHHKLQPSACSVEVLGLRYVSLPLSFLHLPHPCVPQRAHNVLQSHCQARRDELSPLGHRQ
jgi:serine/threonine protein phosphatase PrpC